MNHQLIVFPCAGAHSRLSRGRSRRRARAGGSAFGRSEYEVQALYGRLMMPFFDLQAGIRVAQRAERDDKPRRVYAVLGLQAAPYRFDVEPTLFLSDKGKLSARFTGIYDILLTQRLVLQPRLEANFAAQKDEEFGSGTGFNDAELGFRLRYEIRRQFAPYLDMTWQKSFGGDAQADASRRRGSKPVPRGGGHTCVVLKMARLTSLDGVGR